MRSLSWPAASPMSACPATAALALAATGPSRAPAAPATGPSRARLARLHVAMGRTALCAVLGLGLAACSSGPASKAPSHTSSARSSAPVPTAQPSTGPVAVAAVKAMWQTFFNGAVPIPRRLKLLQNGQRFAPFVHSEEKTSLGTLVLSASATVSSVSLRPPAQAGVTYTILLGGKPLAKNLSGSAVYTNGTWQVADATFCSLLHLAYGKSSHVIPAACGS